MPGSRAARTFLIVVFGLALLATGLAAWRLRQVAAESRERFAVVGQQLKAESQPPDPAGQESNAAPAPSPQTDALRETCVQAAELERELGPAPGLTSAVTTAAQLLARAPRGEQPAAMLSLASAGMDTFAGLRLACEALGPLLGSQAGQGDPPSALAVLAASRDQLRASASRLRAAQEQLATLDDASLDESAQALARLLRDRLPAVRARLAMLAELPTLLGYDAPRTYLLLGQNEDELRPTGGFVGTAGVLTFSRGKLIEREYGTSFRFNVPPDFRVPPPAALREEMQASYWHLREANWWPDFPTAARQATYFYNLVRPAHLDGVLAVDQRLLERLLELSGPIEMAEYGELVSATNVRERLEEYVHLRPNQGEVSRKAFVGALFGLLVERIAGYSQEQLRDLGLVLDSALAYQHLLIWSSDQAVQQAVSLLGGDGQILPVSGDYLYPVHANVGRNKVNRAVDQELAYEVTAEPTGRLVGRASVRLHNRWPLDRPGPYGSDDFRDYFRLYVPPGSELLGSSGFERPATQEAECGRLALAGLVVVPPNETRVVELTYRLPGFLDATSYRLLVQKQPGAASYPLRVLAPGLALEGLTTSLDRHQWIGPRDGGLVASRWRPGAQPSDGSAGCSLLTEPPIALQPLRQLAIPRLGVQAEVVELGVDANGQLEAPETGDVVGWYAQTARPGQVGNVIVSGHLDWSRRPAVFWQLSDLRSGDRVELVAEGGKQYSYEVEWNRSFRVNMAPLHQILGGTTESWLTLITCGGVFDPQTRDYSERVVVRARLVSGS